MNAAHPRHTCVVLYTIPPSEHRFDFTILLYLPCFLILDSISTYRSWNANTASHLLYTLLGHLCDNLRLQHSIIKKYPISLIMADSSMQRMFVLLVTCPSVILIFAAFIFLPRYVPAAFALMVIVNLLGLYTIACMLRSTALRVGGTLIEHE